MVLIKENIKGIYIAGIAASLIIFMLAGSLFPATEKDIANNNAFPFNNNGKYDRGLFTQFFTSIVFVASILLLGLYINSTFVKFGMKNWAIFSIGVYLMFIYGLGKIGELTYNHEIFDAFKDLVLPIALITLVYASYKISLDFKGGK
jgi:hypothetical protein